jgi:protein-glutamine gamma-glutamyltransferase
MKARVLAFLAFATYSALRWSALVAYPPVARTLVVVGLVTLAGMGVASLRPWPGRPWATALARLALIAVAGAAAMVVMGLSPRFLLPSGWSELSDGVGRGILALEIRDWPYAGSDGWVRMTVLLVMPVVLTIAAAFAFWPARRFRGTFRIAAAALLVGLYAVASVQHEPLTPLPSGPVLLALLSAWLFLPEGPRRRAPGAVGMVAAAGCIALPLAAILPATNPVINYRALALGQQHHFLWNQTYGPIDWPRDRDVVLTVDSPEPHYWKAVTLDEFDGERWVLSGKDDGAHPLAELPNAGSDRWRADATVTVDSIDSSALFAPGPILGTQGLESVSIADDGTALTSDDLGPGDSYVIHAYAPDPSAAAMRRVDDGIPGRMLRYTRFALPDGEGYTATPAGVVESTTTVTLARDGDGDRRAAAQRLILDSPYARTYRLARRLAGPAPTTYDAVRRIEEYLRSTYQYGEKPPERPHPLAAFLLRDRIGYCQQFSGAMALMLRMNGIPARVAAGFAPGEGNGTSWVVRDLDAHAWVEVYFHGIGWVPFDPTPPASPAASISSSGAMVSAARGNAGQVGPLIGLGDLGRVGDVALRKGARPSAPGTPGRSAAGFDGGTTASDGPTVPLAPITATLAAMGLIALALGLRRWLRRTAAIGELGELRAAVALLGFPLEPRATLAQLERWLTEREYGLAARHVGLLRERRYGPEPIPPLDPHARRAFRHLVSAGGGPLGHLRGYLALPPLWRSGRGRP